MKRLPQPPLCQSGSSFERRRNLIVDALKEIPGVTCAKPAGTFYVMPLFASILDRKIGGEPIGSSFRLAEILLEFSL